MKENIDLKEIEQKTYLSFHQDGLLDILTGIFILGFGMSIHGSPTGVPVLWTTSTFVSILWTMSIVLFWRVKKAIIYPRLGYVSFSWERRRKEKRKLAALIALWCMPVLVAIVILKGFSSSRYSVWLNENEVFSGQIFAAAFISVGAILSGVKRLYIYAALTLIGFVTDYLLNIPIHLYFIPLGIAVIISGTVVLIRFLHRYAKLAAEVPNGKA